jgi:hypothetical protein
MSCERSLIIQAIRPLIRPIDVDKPVSRPGFEELPPGRFQDLGNRLRINFKHKSHLGIQDCGQERPPVRQSRRPMEMLCRRRLLRCRRELFVVLGRRCRCAPRASSKC